MTRVLLIFVHPAIHRSRANRALVDSVRALPQVTLHDLYAAYPDHLIDVRREQELLWQHDLIVWQHPFYWYSAPSLLKEWQDVVLERGFAYGEQGDVLHGKRVLSAVTTGGPEASYGADGYNHFTLRQLLAPFEQTARLCGMEYLEPFVLHGVRELEDPGLQLAAARYRDRLRVLSEEGP